MPTFIVCSTKQISKIDRSSLDTALPTQRHSFSERPVSNNSTEQQRPHQSLPLQRESLCLLLPTHPLPTGYFRWRVSGISHLTPPHTVVMGPRSYMAADIHPIPHKLLRSPIIRDSLFGSTTNLSCAKFLFLAFYPYFFRATSP